MTHFRHDDPAERERVSVPLAMLPGLLRRHVEAIDEARTSGAIDASEAVALRAEARRTLVDLPVYTLAEIAQGEGR